MWSWLTKLFSSSAAEGAAGAAASETAGGLVAGEAGSGLGAGAGTAATAGEVSAGGVLAGEAGSGLGTEAADMTSTAAPGEMEAGIEAGQTAAAKSGPIAGQEGNIMSEIGGGAGSDSMGARADQTPSFGAMAQDAVENTDVYKSGQQAGQLINNIKNSKFKGVADNITNLSGTMNRGRKGMQETRAGSRPEEDPYLIGLMQGR